MNELLHNDIPSTFHKAIYNKVPLYQLCNHILIETKKLAYYCMWSLSYPRQNICSLYMPTHMEWNSAFRQWLGKTLYWKVFQRCTK